MTDLVPAIQTNALGLTAEVVEKTARAVRAKTAAPLSADRETGLFLLFCSGDTIDMLSFKTQMPIEIIVATAVHYQWLNKAKALGLTSPDDIAQESRKQLLRQLAIATHVSVQKQLTDIIAGREDPSTCRLIPRDIKELEKLLAMIKDLEGTTPPAGGAHPPGVTVINNPQNVQVVQQQTNLPAPEPVSRTVRLRKLREQSPT